MDNQNQIRRLRQLVGTEESIGILGDGSGVIFVVGKNGSVWVRDPQTLTIRDLPLASAVTFDKDAHGKPVRLGYVRGILSVLGVHREAIITTGGNVYIDNPTQAPVLPFIPQQRIMPLVVYPASVSDAPSFELIVRAWMWINHDKQVRFFSGGRVDLSAVMPSAGHHCWAIIAIDDTMSLTVSASTPISSLDPLGLTHLQDGLDNLPPDTMPIWAWDLNGDASGLSENDINQDLRQIVSWMQSAGGGSGTWGTITGTLSDQTDLQSALDTKLDADDYDPVTVGAPDNGLSITDQMLTLDLADDTNAGAMPSAMFNLLEEGRVYLGSQLFTSSGTFSKASFPTAKWFKVTMVGGGGGGSSTHLATMCGSGGAGSPYCIRWIDADDMSASESVTVGNGGAGAIAGGNAGSGGGHSIFMGTTSGLGNGAGSTSAFNQGGASIAGSGLSDLRCFGSGGQSGGNVAGVGSGMGGSNAFGGGAPGRPAQANQPSLDGYIYGGGGAGATHTSRAGGNGAQGMILIEAYG